MADKYGEIQSILEGFVEEGSFGIDIAFEAFKYNRSTNPHIRTSFIPSEAPTTKRLGPGDKEQLDGIFQLDVFYPAGGGSGPALRKADEVMGHFKRGQRLEGQGLLVWLREVKRRRGVTESDWYHIPILVTWQSFVS